MTGKIARLPHQIREEINRRLQDGEPGRLLLAWLNALPQTLRLLADQFGGRPINQANLSAWRNGGFRLWLTDQEFLNEVRAIRKQSETPPATPAHASPASHLTATLTHELAARYAVMLRCWNGNVTDGFRHQLRALRNLCHGVVRLRGREQAEARLEFAHTQWDWQLEQLGI